MTGIQQFCNALPISRRSVAVNVRMPEADSVSGSNSPLIPPGPYAHEVVADYIARPTGRSTRKRKMGRRLGHIRRWLEHVPLDGLSMDVLAPRIYDRIVGRSESIGAVNHDLRVVELALSWATTQPQWFDRLWSWQGRLPVGTLEPDFLVARRRLGSQLGGWFARHLAGELRRRVRVMAMAGISWDGLLEITRDQFYFDGDHHWLRLEGGEGFRENRQRLQPVVYRLLDEARAKSGSECVYRALRPEEWWPAWLDAVWQTRLHVVPDDLASGPYGHFWEQALEGDVELSDGRSIAESLESNLTRGGRASAREQKKAREDELARFEADRELFSRWFVTPPQG